MLTERVDHLLRPDGNVLLSVRLMGAFELDDDKFVRWRDYADPAVLAVLPTLRPAN